MLASLPWDFNPAKEVFPTGGSVGEKNWDTKIEQPQKPLQS